MPSLSAISSRASIQAGAPSARWCAATTHCRWCKAHGRHASMAAASGGGSVTQVGHDAPRILARAATQNVRRSP